MTMASDRKEVVSGLLQNYKDVGHACFHIDVEDCLDVQKTNDCEICPHHKYFEKYLSRSAP
jgi:hypothetical protein